MLSIGGRAWALKILSRVTHNARYDRRTSTIALFGRFFLWMTELLCLQSSELYLLSEVYFVCIPTLGHGVVHREHF